MVIVIQQKYSQLTIETFYRPESTQKAVQARFDYPIKLGTLSKGKPHNRHSPERSQTQPEYLSIDKCISWQLPLILFIKPKPSTKL